MPHRAPNLRSLVVALALPLAAAALTGCARETSAPTAPRAARSGRSAPALAAAALSQAVSVENRYTETLLDYPGVVGIGVGAASATQAVIEVYCLDAVPARFPKSLDGVPVR